MNESTYVKGTDGTKRVSAQDSNVIGKRVTWCVSNDDVERVGKHDSNKTSRTIPPVMRRRVS
jgi:hypothetical protein